MPKRKRGIEPSGPTTPSSRRQPARVAALNATRRSGSETSRGPSNLASSRKKDLSGAALIREVLKIAENEEKAERMILELMEKYNFDFSRLRELLRQNGLNVSFSKVQYSDIAHLVGLNARAAGRDIPTFEMFYARLPKALFRQILKELRVLEAQYGCLVDHTNEEARSRYLAGYFNQIVALFAGKLFNTPETILEGRLATKGRIEYQFNTLGGITVVFIEVKLEIGNATEHLNCLAQVIAVCDACDWFNAQNGYNLPILAVLCDGKRFLFYKFVDKPSANGSPQISLGQFPNGLREIGLLLGGESDRQYFYQHIRRACEAFYYLFLSGYQAGLEAYWNRSVKMGDSTPRWYNSKVQAKRALEEAVSAWNLYEEGKIEESEKSRERAVQVLAESVEQAPFPPRSDFFDLSDFEVSDSDEKMENK